MSALFSGEPYEHFELQAPVIENVTPMSTFEHSRLADDAFFLGHTALFDIRQGEFALNQQEAA